MKTALLVLSAVLGGCTGDASYVCSDDVFAEVHYPTPTDCDFSRAVTSRAWEMMADSGLWAHPNLHSIFLDVRGVPFWMDSRVGTVVGGMFTPGSIEVGSDYGVLIHEMFHAKDWLDMDIARGLAPMHAGWDKDGRDALNEIWRREVSAMLDIEYRTR